MHDVTVFDFSSRTAPVRIDAAHWIVAAGDGIIEVTEVYQIVTRLTATCYKDSRSQTLARITKVQSASGGQMTLLDSATLFELIARGASVPSGDCSRIAEALTRPDRFEVLLR